MMFVIHGYMYCELHTVSYCVIKVLWIILCQNTALVNPEMRIIYRGKKSSIYCAQIFAFYFV